jgi:TonB family protein
LVSVLTCFLGIVGLSKPARKWIRTLPEAVAAAAPIRAAEIVRSENVLSPADIERPTTGAAAVEDVGPRVVKMDPAQYTPTARSAGFRGKVFVVVTIDRQGRVKSLRFTEPMAFDLDTAVFKAASGWRFQPATRDGKSIEGKTLVQVPFR